MCYRFSCWFFNANSLLYQFQNTFSIARRFCISFFFWLLNKNLKFVRNKIIIGCFESVIVTIAINFFIEHAIQESKKKINLFFPAKSNFNQDKPHRLCLDVGDSVIILGETKNWYYGYNKKWVYQLMIKPIPF